MQIQEIFLAAIEIDDLQQRAAYVAQTCKGDEVLHRKVNALIAAHERSGEFLDVPVLQQIAEDESQDRYADQNQRQREEIDLSFLKPSSKPGSLGRLLHYEVLETIGRGGCGIVLKAFDEKLHRVVAIKMMTPELAATSPARKRFLREARTTAAIRHENVVSIYAVEEKPFPFLVMEFIDGQTLQDKINETGPLDIQDVVSIGRQIACGLEAAHAQGLIHRDIKPANILIENGTGRPKITDFGLARSTDDASLTQSGAISGTPLYMSPEQAQGLEVDHRSDLFSLGSVLYVMCSGRPPFRAATAVAVLKRVVEEQPRPIREIIPETPEWLASIIAQLQSKLPAGRFASARKVAELLDDCLLALQKNELIGVAAKTAVDLDSRQGGNGFAPVRKSWIQAWSGGRNRHWIVPVAAVMVLFAIWSLAKSMFLRGTRGESAVILAPGRERVPAIPGITSEKQSAEELSKLNLSAAENRAVAGGGSSYALSFDGIDDYVQIPFTYSGQPPITLEVVLQIPEQGANGSLLGTTQFSGIGIGIHDDGGKTTARFVIGTQRREYQSLYARELPAPGGLINLTAVLNKSEMLFFLSGRLVDRVPLTERYLGNNFDFVLGASPNSGTNDQLQIDSPLKVVVQEVRLSDVARYSEDFISPRRLEADEHTLVLYHFEEGEGDVLKDSSGNGRHGKIVGATWTREDGAMLKPPPPEYALQFDGEDDYIVVPTLKDLLSSPVTVEMYLMTEEPPELASATERFVCQCIQNGHTRTLSHGWKGELLAVENIGSVHLSRGSNPIREWLHVAAVYGDRPQIYINGTAGILDETPRQDSRLNPNPDCLLIGGTPQLRRLFQGSIRAIRVSRGARYQDSFSPPEELLKDEQTLALYQFHEGNGTKLLDSSGNGHHGELHGDPHWVQQSNADRVAAAYVLSIGGKVRVNGNSTDIVSVGDLPATPFHLTSVNLLHNSKTTEVGLKSFVGTHHIRYLELSGAANLTRAAMESFRENRGLKDLGLAFLKFNNDGLESLRHFPELTVLWLNDTQVTDDGLAIVGQLSKLRLLGLYNCRITDRGLTPLIGHPTLVHVDLRLTEVSDAVMRVAETWPALEILELGGDRISDRALEDVKNLRMLFHLRLDKTSVTDAGIRQLAENQALRYLSLSQTGVTRQGIEELSKKLPSCEIHWTGGVWKGGIAQHLDHADFRAAQYVLSQGGVIRIQGSDRDIQSGDLLPKTPFALTSVSLTGRKAVDDEQLSVFEDCTHIQALWLSQTSVSDQGLACFQQCRDLKAIDIGQTKVAGPGLAHFAQCRNLEHVSVWFTRIPLEDFLPLADKPFKILNFGGNSAFSDEWFPHFTHLENLEFLNLRYTKVTNEGLAPLQQYRKLKSLSLGNTKVTDAGLDYLKNCTELEDVLLTETNVTDAGVKLFASCKKLKSLELEKTKVTAAGIEELRQSLPQCRILWDGGVLEPGKL
jgi:serine/threonine protein kinase